MIEIGKKIKALRLDKGITQEQLAEQLLLSPQAVSKWENNQTTPDIELLPQLSVILGVTIDELFDMTDDAHLTRIENMLDDKKDLTYDDYTYAVKFLQDTLKNADKKAHALTLLAALHNHCAESHHSMAADFAKQALELDPRCKENHCQLRDAKHSVVVDWNCSNQHELIAYYQEFVKKHPDYWNGYLWLLDLLIADGRIHEAKETLEAMNRIHPGYLYPLYSGIIAKQEGNLSIALTLWNQMIEQYPNDWLTWFTYGDCMVRLCRYEEAVSAYKKSYELQDSHKYYDALVAIAHIEEIRGNINEAIAANEQIIKLLASDWNVTEGESVDFFRREISRLKEH